MIVTTAATLRPRPWRAIGEIEGIREQFYAISYERRITRPAVTAIALGARTGVLKTP